MSRWIRFFIVLGIGLVVGLFYTWKLNPPQLKDTSPDTLRQDYKTDYVLMVAEVYHANGNLDTAVQYLALLSNQPPLEIADTALRYARGDPNSTEALYPAEYLSLLQELADALKTIQPTRQPTMEKP